MKLVGDKTEKMYLVGDSIYEEVRENDVQIGDLVFLLDWQDFALVESENDIEILDNHLNYELYRKVLGSFV